MRRRTYLTADEWQARLDREMERVLRNPGDFHPAVVQWARFRREWLAESGSLFREPVGLEEVVDAEDLTGPSPRPPAAGETVCARELAAGGENRPKTPERGATARESTTSAHSSLSLHGDIRSARGGGNGARTGGGGGGAAKKHLQCKMFYGRVKTWSARS